MSIAGWLRRRTQPAPIPTPVNPDPYLYHSHMASAHAWLIDADFPNRPTDYRIRQITIASRVFTSAAKVARHMGDRDAEEAALLWCKRCDVTIANLTA